MLTSPCLARAWLRPSWHCKGAGNDAVQVSASRKIAMCKWYGKQWLHAILHIAYYMLYVIYIYNNLYIVKHSDWTDKPSYPPVKHSNGKYMKIHYHKKTKMVLLLSRNPPLRVDFQVPRLMPEGYPRPWSSGAISWMCLVASPCLYDLYRSIDIIYIYTYIYRKYICRHMVCIYQKFLYVK